MKLRTMDHGFSKFHKEAKNTMREPLTVGSVYLVEIVAISSI